jgi:hypothetical protein
MHEEFPMGLTIDIDFKKIPNPHDTNKPGLHSALLGSANAKLKLNGQTRGICFRVSYKWLVTQWKGQVFKGAAMNVEKVYPKQMEYLKQADTMKGQEYKVWFQNSNNLSQTTLQDWGAKHGHSCAAPYTTSDMGSAAPLTGNPDTAMIVGFFGLKNGTDVWGHATAYCCRNNNPKFFDINYGVYDFDAGDNVGRVMQDWIVSKYVDNEYKISDFVLYRIY